MDKGIIRKASTDDQVCESCCFWSPNWLSKLGTSPFLIAMPPCLYSSCAYLQELKAILTKVSGKGAVKVALEPLSGLLSSKEKGSTNRASRVRLLSVHVKNHSVAG